MKGLLQFTCMHKRLTSEDGDGYAICIDCGGTIVARLTRYVLDRSIEAGLR